MAKFDMPRAQYRAWVDAVFTLRNSGNFDVRCAAHELIRDMTDLPGEDWGEHFRVIEKSPANLFERMLVRNYRLALAKSDQRVL